MRIKKVVNVKKLAVGTVAAGSIGLASLGVGAGVASAAPAHQVTQQQQQHQQQWQQQQRPTGQPGAVKRPDHRAFTYRGQRVQPQYNAAHHGWGFWFFGFWVPVVTG